MIFNPDKLQMKFEKAGNSRSFRKILLGLSVMSFLSLYFLSDMVAAETEVKATLDPSENPKSEINKPTGSTIQAKPNTLGKPVKTEEASTKAEPTPVANSGLPATSTNTPPQTTNTEATEANELKKIAESIPPSADNTANAKPSISTEVNPEDRLTYLTSDNSYFVNLAREIERSERERNQRQNFQAKSNDLSVIELELQKRITELSDLENKLNQKSQAIGGLLNGHLEKNENLKLLVSLYESLSPDQAAELLKRLPLSVTLTMVQMMNPKKTSKIIAAMDSKTAAEISQRLIKTPSIAKNTEGAP